MRIRGFLHTDAPSKSTLSQLKTLHTRISSKQALLCFAYARSSGAAQFDIEMGDDFWDEVSTKWLFGIDYGRTHPQALRFIAKQSNASVRIYDGAHVVAAKRFLPRRDFHMKTSFFNNTPDNKYGVVSGSGNFSSGGLKNNIECGISLFANTAEHYRKTFKAVYQDAKALWEEATPLEKVIDQYEDLWEENHDLPLKDDEEKELDPAELDVFWTEAGYVTRNRGDDKPGNQIDLPWLVHRYFGFDTPDERIKNSTFGEITFLTPIGGPIRRNYRYGNNAMEKMTLPIPEQTGLDIYDGKIIFFQRERGAFKVGVLENEDFEKLYRGKLVGVQRMGSGRRYGYIR